MLHLIPPGLQRPLMPLAHGLRRTWQRLVRAELHGASVIAFNEQDRLLLVRHSYGTPKWTMPAGGLKRGEDPEFGIRREVREELRIDLHDLQLVQRRQEEVHGLVNHVWLFTARVKDEPQPDMREVTHAGFFAIDDLPDWLEKRVRPRLDLLREMEG